MRRSLRWFLIAVLALNAVGAAVLLGSSVSDVQAETPATAAEGTEVPVPERDALLLLGRELAERAANLERRESELDELLRGEEVLRRAGIDPLAGDPAEAQTPVTPQVVEDPAATAAAFAFEKLQRAYENMEPESAAAALTRLADMDKDAVVQLLLGWQPRTSGAILDALAQSTPELAADLSYEIWKRTGKNGSQAARTDR